MTDRPDDSDPRPVARPAAVQTAAAVAQRFLEAIIWAEHLTVWEMLAPSAREVALAGAGRRGLDAVAAERARLGTWNETQRDAWQEQVLQPSAHVFAEVGVPGRGQPVPRRSQARRPRC